MGIEYELKYAATEEAQDAIFRALAVDWQTYAMHTTYYDAPDGSLSARKWMLRHRLENEAHVCTLKTPVGDARGEWEVEADTIEGAILKLCKLGAPEELLSLTEKGVVPVCGASFTRRAALVQGVEVALDRGFLYAGTRQEPLCEVEVEQKSADLGQTDRFATGLARQFRLTPLTKSKFKRALALREKL